MYSPKWISHVSGYINAGGRGTRLATLFDQDPILGISKAMLEIGNPKIKLIDHQINKLLNSGVQTVIAGSGDHYHVAEYVNLAYADSLSEARVLGMSVDSQLGNGGDLIQLLQIHPEAFDETIIVVNADTILSLDEMAALAFHKSVKAAATIVLTTLQGVPNQGAFLVREDGLVLHSSEAKTNCIDYETALSSCLYKGSSTGAVIIEADFLRSVQWIPTEGYLSLYHDILSDALLAESLYAYNNAEGFFIDIGTVPSWTYITDHPEVIAPHIQYSNAVMRRRNITHGQVERIK